MTETNRTPYRQTRVVKSLEVVNDLGHIICNCDVDENPKAINIGNAEFVSRVLNEHSALVRIETLALEYSRKHNDPDCEPWREIRRLAALRNGKAGAS